MGKKDSLIVYFKVPIYKAWVLISVNKTEEELQDYIDLKWDGNKGEIQSIPNKWDAQVQELNDGLFILQLKRFPDSVNDDAILVHEIFHLVFRILRRVGLGLSPKSEEAFAYLGDYLYKRIIKILYPKMK